MLNRQVTWSLGAILADGQLVETDTPPTREMPGIGFMRRYKAHRAFRLTDDRWHYFRYTNAVLAEETDRAYNRPML